MTVRRRSIFFIAALIACAALPAAAHGATYLVRAGGSDVGDCTVTPCATVQYAIDQHRVAPAANDVIDVGAGTFVGNVDTGDPADDGLTIRGTLSGGTRQTTLRGEGAGVSGIGSAVLLGFCGVSEVDLRDVNVDSQGTDPTDGVFAIEADGGSDLRNVHASNLPDSEAGFVVDVCQQGTVIRDSTIESIGSAVEDAGIVGFAGFQLIDSHIVLDADAGPGIANVPFAPDKPRLIVRRSWIESDPANINPAIIVMGTLFLDSSLITGGEIGVARDFPFRARWAIVNSTIDVGTPGAYDAGMPDLLLMTEDGAGRIEAAVTNSILADEIASDFFVTAPGPGSLSCSHTNVQAVVLDPTITDNCDITGGNPDGNTTTDPALQFANPAGGDWSLLATAPALEAGTPGPVAPGFSARDLAGNARIAAASAADCAAPVIDMGAYEFVGVPCNLQAPVVKNGAAPVVGAPLGANPGKWSNRPTSFQNQWLRCDADGVSNCTPIMAYRSDHRGYTPTAADIGSTLRVRFIASNATGDSDPATSAATGVVGP